ncbi:MAG: protein translocase subunit SecF [Candidatus Pacebacteria bacterium]|nr:protein translocase subunit SecF [Candidatus Paceibacterota bacterium]
MNIIRHKKIFFIISSLLVVASIVLVAVKGIPQSIEFKGGALLEVLYTDSVPTLDEVRLAVEQLELGYTIIQPTGDTGYIIKSRDLTELQRETLLQALSLENTHPVETKTFTSIGPSVGKELKNKAIISIILVVLSIILFVAYAFRKVSQPVSSWKFGVAAVLSLVHDVIITTGAFAVFAIVFGAEMDVLFVVALLTVLGVSVNDTIVVFDRVRENIEHNVKEKLNKTFETVVGESISQTMARSVNTSLTVVLVLLALYFFGPTTTKIFSLTMTVGMLIGTFSSIFLASPLLVVWQQMQDKK